MLIAADVAVLEKQSCVSKSPETSMNKMGTFNNKTGPTFWEEMQVITSAYFPATLHPVAAALIEQVLSKWWRPGGRIYTTVVSQ